MFSNRYLKSDTMTKELIDLYTLKIVKFNRINLKC